MVRYQAKGLSKKAVNGFRYVSLYFNYEATDPTYLWTDPLDSDNIITERSKEMTANACTIPTGYKMKRKEIWKSIVGNTFICIVAVCVCLH